MLANNQSPPRQIARQRPRNWQTKKNRSSGNKAAACRAERLVLVTNVTTAKRTKAVEKAISNTRACLDNGRKIAIASTTRPRHRSAPYPASRSHPFPPDRLLLLGPRLQ